MMNAEIVAAIGDDRFGFKHHIIGLQTFCQQRLTKGVICVAGLFVGDCTNCTVSQRIVEKRFIIVRDKDQIGISGLQPGQPLHGNIGGLLQAGSDRADVAAKRSEMVSEKAVFGYLQVEQGHEDHDRGSRTGA